MTPGWQPTRKSKTAIKTGVNSFSKQERLYGTLKVNRLFTEGNRKIAVFPVKIVWLLTDEPASGCGVRLLISVPKRNFHHAVDRNRIKRQIREFYRTSSAPLKKEVELQGRSLWIAILYTDSRLWSTHSLAPRLQTAMERLSKALSDYRATAPGNAPEP